MKDLQNNPGYIESIGKVDKQGFFSAMNDRGEATAIRVCFWRHH